MNLVKKEYLLLFQYMNRQYYKYFSSLDEMDSYIKNDEKIDCIRGKLKINDDNYID